MDVLNRARIMSPLTLARLGSAAGLFIACSPVPVHSGRCARTASITSLDPSLMTEYREESGVGGYLVAPHATDLGAWEDPATHEVSFCTAFIQPNVRFAGEFALWTAAHCIDYAKILSFGFIRYNNTNPADGAGTWESSEPLRTYSHVVSQLRARGETIPQPVFNALLSVFANPRERQGAGWCRQFTEANRNPDTQQLCISLDDLEMFRFNTQSSPLRGGELADVKEAVAALPPIEDNQLRDTLNRWQTAYIDLADARMRLLFARYFERVNSCQEESSDPICPFSLRAIQIGRALFSRILSFNPKRSEEEATRTYQNARNEVQQLWTSELVPTDRATLAEHLRIHGGFRFIDNISDPNSEFSPTAIPTGTAFLGLPLLAGLGAFQTRASVVVGSQGLLLNLPLTQALRFHKGDSGTMVSFSPSSQISFPLGVISTVDGEPSSGGLAMRPVATGEEAEEESGKELNANPRSTPQAAGAGCD